MNRKERVKSAARGLVVLGAVLFGVSSLLPVVASISHTDPPPWLGWLDGVLAFAVVVVMIVIQALARGKVDAAAQQLSYRIYRSLAHLLIVLLIVFFLFGNAIKWDVLLIGWAWRSWVLVYTLPAALVLARGSIYQDMVS